MKDYKRLGLVNAWPKDHLPKELEVCDKEKHVKTVKYLNASGAWREVSCDKCKYYYEIDSGD